jgi:hypothetical protein
MVEAEDGRQRREDHQEAWLSRMRARVTTAIAIKTTDETTTGVHAEGVCFSASFPGFGRAGWQRMTE